MNIIVFDNGHLNFSDALGIKCESLKRNTVDVEDYNSWLSTKLNEALSENQYDLIVLPFSLSNQDYCEFSGLTAAAYIRLDNTINSKKPILFVGPENISLINAVSDLASILYTPYIYTTNINLNNTNIEKWCIKNISVSLDNIMSDEQYERFLHIFNLQAPTKFGDRHSIANEWAVHRWADMFGKNIESIGNENLLFYKLLRARLGETQEFTKKWIKKHPGIARIDIHNPEQYTVSLIDDDYDKGWESVLRYVIEEESGIKFNVFKDFSKDLSKDELLDKVKEFIDKTPSNCYILDLRLHENDSGTKDYKKLSGHEISSYILNKNKGNRVIIFTASNKVWNLKEEMPKGICGYSIKESPEQMLSVDSSYKLFADLISEINEACCQAYIKEYIEFLSEYSVHELDEFIDLLLIEKNRTKESTLKSIILILLVYVENHINENFKFGILSDDGLYLKESNKLIKEDAIKHIYIKKDELSNGHKSVVDVKYTDDGDSADSSFSPANKTFDLTLVLSALHYYYHLPNDRIVRFLKAKEERNKAIAHGGGKINLKIEDARYLFENIVKNIIKKDYTSDK